jgi:hypothetical protein
MVDLTTTSEASPAPSAASKLERASYKLRQAEVLNQQLRSLDEEIARSQRNAGGLDHRLLLDTNFLACFGAVQAVYYILYDKAREFEPCFQTRIADWRNGALDAEGRAHFNRLMNIRDRDVHFGEVPGEALAKMIPISDQGSFYEYRNPGIFGPNPATEFVNPDDKTVSGRRGLQGSVGLYITIGGKRCEATDACDHFIAYLQGLIQFLQ